MTTLLSQFEHDGARYAVIAFPLGHPAEFKELTAAELVVADGLLEGLSIRELAARRKVSVNTTANQIASIYRKVGVCSRHELVALARNGARVTMRPVAAPIGECSHDASNLRAAAERASAPTDGSEHDRAEALGLWRSLFHGQCFIVARFDCERRRLFVARYHDPNPRPPSPLRDRERELVNLLALGHSIKLCCYELELAQSSASELASSALRKMGIRSRTELVELYGAIASDARARA